MFENLGERLQNALHKIKGYGKITEDNISDMMREIRLALLEADVNYKVVKEFTNSVKEKALGTEVKKSINPGDMFVKIVKDELVELLGGDSSPLYVSGKPSVLMLVGLQGSGKTTTIAKLGLYLRKKEKKKPLLVAGDIYRPAAIKQLEVVGIEINLKEVKYNEFNKYLENGKYDLVLVSNNYGYSPSLKKYFGTENLANYQNEEIINIISDIDNISDENELKQKYTRIMLNTF